MDILSSSGYNIEETHKNNKFEGVINVLKFRPDVRFGGVFSESSVLQCPLFFYIGYPVHNAAPFENFFFALTELSASRY